MFDDPLLFKDKYRIPTTRLEGWRYVEGLFYVTIVTNGRYPWFGHIDDGRMILSEAGKIVDDCWNKIPIIRPNVSLDEYVVMHDHFHGILTLHRCDTELHGTVVETPHWGVSTGVQHHPKYNPEWMSGCLGAIVNQFKGACTKRIRNTVDFDFAWQDLYHEHIIRNEKDLDRIRDYIVNNPGNWKEDFE